MASFSRRDPIHWCKATTDGRNPMRLKMPAVSPNGTVAEVSLGNGKAQTQIIGNAYAQQVEVEKLQAGWVKVNDCECRSYEQVGTLHGSKDLCDKCTDLENIIHERRTAKTNATLEYGSQFESRMDKVARVMEANMVGDQRPKLSDDQLATALNMPTEKKSGRKAK